MHLRSTKSRFFVVFVWNFHECSEFGQFKFNQFDPEFDRGYGLFENRNVTIFWSIFGTFHHFTQFFKSELFQSAGN